MLPLLFTEARVSFEVFLPIMQTINRAREQHSAEDFTEGFRMFDKEQNGFISSAELRHILTCLGKPLYYFNSTRILPVPPCHKLNSSDVFAEI